MSGCKVTAVYYCIKAILYYYIIQYYINIDNTETVESISFKAMFAQKQGHR